ncbi:hypothetical protein HY637_02885 [Candidatus Woesearchaeota archaeon]|nr:hypothetical protein [Candidatus Pacearchaeota archaeon]MBI4452347.1 hypothetical protein [Candidatus Woesearchaeota archaeon]
MPNCITYDSLMASLKEISENDLSLEGVYAKGALQTLEKYPHTGGLLKEELSNTSCKDLSEIARNIATSVRETSVGSAAGNIGHFAEHLSHSLPIIEDREPNQAYGQGIGIPIPSSGGYTSPLPNGAVYGGAILATVLILALAAKGGKDTFNQYVKPHFQRKQP